MGKIKLLNINYLGKNIKDLKELPGVELKATYDCGDTETDYNVFLNGEHVASTITDTDSGLIKYFEVNENFKNMKLLGMEEEEQLAKVNGEILTVEDCKNQIIKAFNLDGEEVTIPEYLQGKDGAWDRGKWYGRIETLLLLGATFTWKQMERLEEILQFDSGCLLDGLDE